MSEPNSTVATVHRTHVGDHFLIVPNATCRGQLPVPLKAMARCILLHLLSLPEGWKIDRAQIDRGFVEGRDAVSKGLRELEQAGYLVRTKRQDETGQWVWTWRVTDDPVAHPLSSQRRNLSAWSEQGKPESAQVAPPTENPSPVGQSILEDGPKNTDQKTDPLVRHEGQGVEPLPARVAVATTSVSAQSDGAHQSPASLLEAHVARWRAAGVLCEGCHYRSAPHRKTGLCRG